MVCLLKSNGPNQANPVWAVHDPKRSSGRIRVSGLTEYFAASRQISPP